MSGEGNPTLGGDFGQKVGTMNRPSGIRIFTGLVVLGEGAIMLASWIKASTLPALHVTCEPSVIGGVQYYCKQPFVDVPAQFEADRFVGLTPWVIVMTILLVGVTLLVIAAVRRAWRGRRGVVRGNERV
jgi:hypothetical protein